MSRANRPFIAVIALIVTTGLAAPVRSATITLTTGTKYQTVDGFGASQCNIVAWKVKIGPFYHTVDLDSVGFYDSLAQDMHIMRLLVPPMQASEGAAYDDVTFPHVAELARRGVTRFWGSVLSPPGWMKSNGQETQGGNLLSQYYDDFGRMLAEYTRQFKQKIGVELYALSIQNEPRFTEPYASCVYSSTSYRDLARVVGPLVAAVSPTTKLMGPEDVLQAGGTSNSWVQAILGDATAGQYFGVYAVHCHSEIFDSPADNYDGWWNTVQTVADPNNLALWMSETGDNFDTTWNTAVWLATTIANSFKRGNCRGWVWWATAEDANLNAMVRNGWYSQKYYQMAHFGRFVRPGARRIESSSSVSYLQEVAFQNSDNTVVVVIPNASSTATTLSLSGAGLSAQFRAYQSLSTSSMMRDAGLVNTGSTVSIPAWSITTLTSNTATPVRGQTASRTAASPPLCRQAPAAPMVLLDIAQASRVMMCLYSTTGALVARSEQQSTGGTTAVGWQDTGLAPGLYVAHVHVEPLAGGPHADHTLAVQLR